MSGELPRPIKIGRAAMWLATDIEQFIAERIAASRPAPEAR
jgi:predicted DNA-binding transcriptional regulator AlpA